MEPLATASMSQMSSVDKQPLPAIQTISTVASFAESFGQLSGDDQMPMQQLQLLLQLYIHTEIVQGDLPRFTGVAKSANSRNIAKLGDGERPLEKPGLKLVESFEDPTNRRQKIVRLTTKGRELLEAAAARVKPPRYSRAASA